MMSRRFLLAILLAFSAVGAIYGFSGDALLPVPNKVVPDPSGRHLVIPARIGVSGIDNDGSYLTSEMKRVFTETFPQVTEVVTQNEAPFVSVSIEPERGVAGSYRLSVAPDGIRIAAADSAGVLYAIRTLEQLTMGEDTDRKNGEIACVTIDDAPRYSYRALMIDPARHFLPAEDVKRFIDIMSFYKYNVLQLHLTDDEGWRVEIISHPELTSGGEYYTQDELRDIVRYAAGRSIEIVPEIDIPGHTSALLASHPELACQTPDTARLKTGDHNRMVCAAVEGVYPLYDEVIAELAGVFPSSRIHLGGDEAAVSANWAVCPRCAALMAERGFEKPEQLMSVFFGRILDSVRRHGKQPVMWCELDNMWMPANEYMFPYPDDVTLVTWRNGLTPKCIELTHRHGHNLIMAPGEYAYFDYPQWKGDLPEFNNWGMPITPLQRVYELDPSYGLPQEGQKHILGVMGTMWGEAIPDINRLTYMTYPRALALAEAGWSNMDVRSWESFRNRMLPNLDRLMRRGVSFRVPFEVTGAEAQNLRQ